MPRIESPDSSPVSIDTPPDPTPASSPREAKVPTPPSRNEVRAYDGPPAPAARPPGPSTPKEATAEPPVSERVTVSAGELAALGGRTPPTSSEVPARLYADLRSHLAQGLTSLFITSTDVKAVHTLLGQLPPAAYHAALERMNRDHLLGTYVEKQDAGARQAFLEQAESKGVLQRSRGEPASGPLGMPGRPDFFVNDAKLPGALRDAVNAHAIDAGRAYLQAHGAYLDRYTEVVGRAQSFPELRALGPYQEPRLDERALGLAWKDPERKRYEAGWKAGIGRPASPSRALEAIEDKRKELRSLSAGRYALETEAEMAYGSLKVGGEARLDSKGDLEAKGKHGVKLDAAPYSAEVLRDTSGHTKTRFEVDMGVASARLDSEGEVELALEAGGLLKAYSVVNAHEAEFGGGVMVGVEHEESHTKAKVKVAFGMRGLSAETARRAVDRNAPGLFDRPPELDAGVSWDVLPQPRRADYAERLGWTREEWTAAR